MKPNPLLWALMTVFSVAPSWAEQLANTEEIQSVKTFSPPKPIAPTAAIITLLLKT